MTQTVPLAHLASTKPTATESSSRKTLCGLALAVAKAKRIVVVTGAGISCSSGIPDFRSSDGLYNLVKSRYPEAVLKGRDLFDSALFRDPTSSAVFYTFMAELKTQIDSAHPAPVHDFLATLDGKGKLLRSYTQNIDGLEERAGLRTGECNPAGGGGGGEGGIRPKPKPKNVQLHGDIHRVRCTLCSASMACTPDHIDQFRTGTPPDCPECIARSDARTARAARALKCGTLRPAIVLYDEPHPLGDHIGAVQTSDLGKKPDLLIVMGTSLKVHGLRKLVKAFAKAVHSSRPLPGASGGAGTTSHSLLHNVVFVNRTAPPPGEWTGIIDYHVQGDADTWVAHVLGEWKKSRPADWEVQSTLDLGALGTITGKEKEGKEQEKGKGKKKGGVKAGGAENTPPEPQPPQPSRCVIVLPRKSQFKAQTVKSPLKASSGHGHRTTQLKGKGKCQLGMSSPRKLGGSLKRPAASPLAPRQTRLDGAFRSPARVIGGKSRLGSGTALGASSSGSTSSSTTTPEESSSTEESSPTTSTSALSSQVDLSQSSHASRSSTSTSTSTASTSHDSIFSSQSTASSQSTLASASQGTSALCSQDSIRYTGPPRPAPFGRRRFKTVPQLGGGGGGSDWGSLERPRAGTIPLSSQVSVGPPPAPSLSLLGSSGSFLAAPEKRYVATIKSPAAVPRLSYWDEGSPRKKGRVSEEREQEQGNSTEDEGGVPQRLTFMRKGKGKQKADDDVIDLDPDDDDDSMSLDGAVGHMSLAEEIIDVEGDTDVDIDMEPAPAPPPLQSVKSPIRTRAGRIAKEREIAATKRASKKGSVLPQRQSMRIRAKTS